MASGGCYILKKILVLSLCVILIAAFTFADCNKKSDDKTTTNSKDTTVQASDLENNDNEYGLETEDVTDKDGKTVTDAKGKAVTTDVAVVYKKDKKGNTYAQKLDKDGKAVTNKKGKPVTVKAETTKKKKTSRVNADTTGSAKTTAKETKPVKVTGTTKKNVPATKSDDTTAFDGMETVPKTSATGKEVNFSKEDQQIIANMLEVPYLYLASYENSKGVPINIAAYTAVWMAQHDGGTASTYPSSPVVLNLFKFYGQTVVNFKTQVNKVDSTPIKYNSKNDTFSVSKYPKKKQTVKITKIEDLGDNNFYKVTGKVSKADGVKKVQAVVQKNKLDSTLGFSIKALKWS